MEIEIGRTGTRLRKCAKVKGMWENEWIRELLLALLLLLQHAPYPMPLLCFAYLEPGPKSRLPLTQL